MHIVVLMGGWSAEREVSLVTGAAVADALERSGHNVLRFDIQPDFATLLEVLAPAPDAIFNALHGQFGEDGGIQAILNLLKIT
jgi:D-alanine-D-alanine ligase